MTRAALCIGQNYAAGSQGMQLNGCYNDADHVAHYLETRRGYTDDQITKLYDATRDEIVTGILNLAERSKAEALNEVFLHYSGHGTQVRDSLGVDRDEVDGKDEALVPCDHSEKGVISDDELNALLQQFDRRTRVIFFVDSCHSGTMCDLPYRYDVQKDGTIHDANLARGKATAAHVLAVSGCKDVQCSMDAYDVRGNKEFTGAMTSCLLETLRRTESPVPLGNFMCGLYASLSRRGFVQRPVLTSSHPVDLGSDVL